MNILYAKGVVRRRVRAETGAIAASLLAASIVLAGCATADYGIIFDEDDRNMHAQHLEEWCNLVGPCAKGANGRPFPLAPLPKYDDVCGYLPPIYGDDC